MKQTFLTDVQVDGLVAMYEAGAVIREIAEHFSVHHTTVVAHLRRRSVSMRHRGLDEAQFAEAAARYAQGLTLLEVGRRFGVGKKAVRRAVIASGGTIRLPAHHVRRTGD